MTDNQQWFIKTNSGKSGPFTFEDLQYFADRQKIKPNTAIGHGDSTWVKAKRVEGLYFSGEPPAGRGQPERSVMPESSLENLESGTFDFEPHHADASTGATPASIEPAAEATIDGERDQPELASPRREVDWSRREGELAGRESKLAAREADLARRETEFANREEQFAQRTAALGKREDKCDALEMELRSRESELGCRDADVQLRETELARREAELRRREAQLLARETAAAEANSTGNQAANARWAADQPSVDG
jgi:hypothetical protein